MASRFFRICRMRVHKLLRRLARSTGTSHAIAMGAGIGMFVAMTPTMGFQMIIAAVIATLFRANRVTAILPVWISKHDGFDGERT